MLERVLLMQIARFFFFLYLYCGIYTEKVPNAYRDLDFQILLSYESDKLAPNITPHETLYTHTHRSRMCDRGFCTCAVYRKLVYILINKLSYVSSRRRL